MKPRRFDYARPDSADEAVAVLTEYGDAASVLAGGQSLMAMLNLRIAEPAVLIDIARLKELDYIRVASDKVEVGAAVTQNWLKDWPELAIRLPLLAAALPFVGHPKVQNALFGGIEELARMGTNELNGLHLFLFHVGDLAQLDVLGELNRRVYRVKPT